jgi:4,5-dihydroxyphthalate decarboxylase
MQRRSLTLLTKDYGYLGPLAGGDVAAEDIDLTFVRSTATALNRTLSDPSIDAGELSFARHIIRIAEDDHSFTGIPFFVVRAFRHRCFFVRRGSSLRGLKDLRGRRIGTNEWPATGNTWSRAALREQGVSTQEIDWWVGPVDGAPSGRPQGALPSNAHSAPPGRTLREMLMSEAIDALMVPDPPPGFYAADSPIVRLIPDYPSAERDYYRRTKLYPAHHIIGMRKATFVQAPWVARRLYSTLEASKTRWLERINELTETTPWLLAEIEASQTVFGRDWNPSGVAANLTMIQALCDEHFVQGLISRRVAAAEIFQEFEAVR